MSKLVDKFKMIPAVVGEKLNDLKYDRLADYDLSGFKRVYHVHIRKTGGTSLNHIFLALAGSDSAALYDTLAQNSDHREVSNGMIFVGWNRKLINKGEYFYAFSHIPFYKLKLPVETCTVTCLRDPAGRVVSHYKMLLGYKINNVPHPCMTEEGKWLGSSFGDFLERVPKEHLLNQLYMFSKAYKVEEAYDRIKGLSHYFFTESFEAGIEELSKKLKLPLKSLHMRKTDMKVEVDDTDMERLRSMLEKEYILIEKLKAGAWK